MAKASKLTIPPVPVEPRVVIMLELSIEEAETLKGITDRIGGPFKGRRSHMSAIALALYDAGVRGTIEDSEVEQQNRAIYFTGVKRA